RPGAWLWTAALAVALLGMAGSSAAADKKALRADALLLMQAAVRVATGARYCDEHVQHNAPLLDAAKRWSERQRDVLERVAAFIEKSGGLSSGEKDAANRAAFAAWKGLDAGGCDELLRNIESGTLDLDKSAETAAALQRIMASASP